MAESASKRKRVGIVRVRRRIRGDLSKKIVYSFGVRSVRVIVCRIAEGKLIGRIEGCFRRINEVIYLWW